jgi:RNA polymerase sigma-70 factor, ECF subfamily
MMKNPSANNDLLQPYHGYLWALAYAQLDRRLRGKLDASDIVQQTLLRAHVSLPELRDKSPVVLCAWLRQILATELADAVRHFRRDKRNITRERSLAADIDQSAVSLENWLVASQTSPSRAAARNEELVHLTDALLQLPEDQREAVILRHLRDRPLQQIAEETGHTTASVAGLLRRGLARLREILERTETRSQ